MFLITTDDQNYVFGDVTKYAVKILWLIEYKYNIHNTHRPTTLKQVGGDQAEIGTDSIQHIIPFVYQ